MRDMLKKLACFRSAPDWYLIVTSDLTIVEASSALLKILGKSRNVIIGQNLLEFLSEAICPMTSILASEVYDSVQWVIQNKKINHLQIQHCSLKKKSSTADNIDYLKMSHAPVLSPQNEVEYVIHRMEDITQIVALKQMGREHEQHLQLLIENIKDYAIMMLDNRGCVSIWNSGAEAIMGYTAEEILGKHISIFSSLEDKNQNHADYELKVARTKGRYEEEGWRVRKNGSMFWANIIITPIYDANQVLIGYGKVTRDLTIQKEIENLKNEFISVVNHELRTPLTSIHGAIRLVSEMNTATNMKLNYLLKIAHANCDRLLRLIQDIRDIELIEAGHMSFHFEVCNLKALIQEAIQCNRIYSEALGIKIIAPPIRGDYKVYIDPDRLMQVLNNLLSNAVKYSFPHKAVKVRVYKRGQKVRVAISNEGEDISEEFKTKIFQKFSQEDSSIGREKSGTGLGLAISKAIMEQFQSELHFTSRQGMTTFYFDLPRYSATEGAV